jgi:hypothetical protein
VSGGDVLLAFGLVVLGILVGDALACWQRHRRPGLPFDPRCFRGGR